MKTQGPGQQRGISRVVVFAGIAALALIVIALAHPWAVPTSNSLEALPVPLVHAEDPDTATPAPEPQATTEPTAGIGGELPLAEAEVEQEPQAMPETPSVADSNPAIPPAEACIEQDPGPLPTPGVAGSQGFWNSFREPLPPAAVWNPPGAKRVGLQAGHWLTNEVPKELSRLAGGGTAGGGYAEWQVNLDIARRAAAILESYGVQVDVLPATVPLNYHAHAFIALHADGDISGALRGFKVARAGFSPIPRTDDVLVEALNTEYGAATGLRRDDLHISRRMQYYYAFNSRRYCHSIAPGVPGAIVEMGFLTNPADRAFMVGQADTVAWGVAKGVLSFLDYLDTQR